MTCDGVKSCALQISSNIAFLRGSMSGRQAGGTVLHSALSGGCIRHHVNI